MIDFKPEKIPNNVTFNCESDLIRMMLLLLNELKKIHKENILHRDIKCENIMFYEKNQKLFFCFIDFGSSFDLLSKDNKKRIQTFTPGYNAIEQNTPMESFQSKL